MDMISIWTFGYFMVEHFTENLLRINISSNSDDNDKEGNDIADNNIDNDNNDDIDNGVDF